MSSPSQMVTRTSAPITNFAHSSFCRRVARRRELQPEPTTSDDELQALLQDDPLTQISVAALKAPDGGVGPGSGGSTGSGMGSGGSMVSGSGGSIGSAGTTGAGGTGIILDGGAGTTGIAGTACPDAVASSAPLAEAAAAVRCNRPAGRVELRRLQHHPHQPARLHVHGKHGVPRGQRRVRRRDRRPGGRPRGQERRPRLRSRPAELHLRQRRDRGGLVQPRRPRRDADAVPQARRRYQRVCPGAEEPEVRVRRQPGRHGRQRDLPEDCEGERMDPRGGHL